MIRIMESFFRVIPGIKLRTIARKIQVKYVTCISFPETELTIARQIQFIRYVPYRNYLEILYGQYFDKPLNEAGVLFTQPRADS